MIKYQNWNFVVSPWIAKKTKNTQKLTTFCCCCYACGANIKSTNSLTFLQLYEIRKWAWLHDIILVRTLNCVQKFRNQLNYWHFCFQCCWLSLIFHSNSEMRDFLFCFRFLRSPTKYALGQSVILSAFLYALIMRKRKKKQYENTEEKI